MYLLEYVPILPRPPPRSKPRMDGAPDGLHERHALTRFEPLTGSATPSDHRSAPSPSRPTASPRTGRPASTSARRSEPCEPSPSSRSADPRPRAQTSPRTHAPAAPASAAPTASTPGTASASDPPSARPAASAGRSGRRDGSSALLQDYPILFCRRTKASGHDFPQCPELSLESRSLQEVLHTLTRRLPIHEIELLHESEIGLPPWDVTVPHKRTQVVVDRLAHPLASRRHDGQFAPARTYRISSSDISKPILFIAHRRASFISSHDGRHSHRRPPRGYGRGDVDRARGKAWFSPRRCSPPSPPG